MAKSAGEHIGDALKNVVNLKKIADAFLRGGWKAAAWETAKRYWPQLLAVGLVLLLLPVIIFVSVPTMLFEGTSSDGINADTLLDHYDALCEAQVNMLVTEAQADPAGAVEIVGEQMPQSDFKALLCVASGNDMRNISSESIADLITGIIVSDTYILPEDGITVYSIRYLTMEEYMERAAFADTQKDWALLLRENMMTEGISE